MNRLKVSRQALIRVAWNTAISVATVMAVASCGGDKGESGKTSAYAEQAVLAGRTNQFSAFTAASESRGQHVLVVSGLIGDLPGLSDAVESVTATPPAGGTLTLVPRANTTALRLGQRAPGGDLNSMFGPETSPAYRDLVTALQALADTSDVLIVVTDQQEDVGHSLFYSDDAPASTVVVAQAIADRINENLPLLNRNTGNDFEEVFALRSGRTNSFVAWASGRRKPSISLELALFGGRDEGEISVAQQTALARLAVTAALVEIGSLDEGALHDAVNPSAAPASSAPTSTPEVSANDPGLHYTVDGASHVHVPGTLFGLPASGTLRIDDVGGPGLHGLTLDVAGVGGTNDVGVDIDLATVGGSMLELRYMRGGEIVWTEPVLVGDAPAGRMVLQDTLGANPWIASFPWPESWLYLNADYDPAGTVACTPCGIPGTVRVERLGNRAVAGTGKQMREYRLSLDGVGIGRLLVAKWSDSGGNDLVDITEVNEQFGLSPGIAVDMRYATPDNFLGADVYDGVNRCLLKRDVAEALARVQRSLQQRGLGLKVYDCLRPHQVQYRMWTIRPEPGYVAPPETGSNHNRGAAVDLTLVNAQGEEVQMPTPYDDFTPKAWQSATEGLTERQIMNRGILRDAMTGEGFTTIRKEWWHYNGPGADRYTENLDIDLGTGVRRMPMPGSWRGSLVARR